MKPICFFDLETTGVDSKNDRIVEICVVKVEWPNTQQRIIKHTLVNPAMPIPVGASNVHGITNDKVAKSPTFSQLAKGVFEFISGCDLAGFNSNSFDIPLLYNEFLRAGIVWDYTDVKFIDACVIFKRKEERTLSAAVKFYTGKEHVDAHGAQSDVLATIDVLEAQLARYDLGFNDLDFYCNYDKPRYDLSGCFAKDDSGDWIMNFGKHKGAKAKSCSSYLTWMLGQDFLPDTKKIIHECLNYETIN